MNHSITIRQPNETEFTDVKKYVKEFWLDDENMQLEQFKVLLYNDKLAAFGRLKKHTDSTELCTLGVVEEFQKKHLGATMVKGLLDAAKGEVYLVTVIPDFFIKQGFVMVQDYPPSIHKKTEMCGRHHNVGTPYVVMKYSSH